MLGTGRRPFVLSAAHDGSSGVVRCDKAIDILNVTESSVIVRVRGPLVRWNRSASANRVRAGCAIADGSTGELAFRRALSVFTILSSRSIRRHNVTSARACIAVHIDEASSLLP